MSHYRVCLMDIEKHEVSNFVKFDNKEDAEHYAKNQSVADSEHIYEVQKNFDGEFAKIKSYLNGKDDGTQIRGKRE